MGRKRNQGKARKAAKAKAREEAEERENNNGQTTANEPEEQVIAAQIQWMQSGNKCNHGFDPLSSRDVVSRFVPAFLESFNEAESSGISLQECLLTAHKAMRDKCADVWVWNDSSKLEWVVSFFLREGTQDILKGDYDCARANATVARYFEQYIALNLKQTQPNFRWNKIYETQDADPHTLVTFFRKRITCSCLDEKYEEVKSISKMGMCFNPQCTLPNGMTKRSKTMYCDGCLSVTYCSRECQKADWSMHKSKCEACASLISAFEAMKQS